MDHLSSTQFSSFGQHFEVFHKDYPRLILTIDHYRIAKMDCSDHHLIKVMVALLPRWIAIPMATSAIHCD